VRHINPEHYESRLFGSGLGLDVMLDLTIFFHFSGQGTIIRSSWRK
jgi:hypothetical protein